MFRLKIVIDEMYSSVRYKIDSTCKCYMFHREKHWKMLTWICVFQIAFEMASSKIYMRCLYRTFEFYVS